MISMKGQFSYPKYNLKYPGILEPSKSKKRKPFKISTKKKEWNRAAGRDPYGPFIKTSYCRNPKCRRKLIWGDRSYEFDHKDNNPSNISQNNCWLVCRNCHGKHTKFGTRIVKDRFTGMVIGRKTIKKKVGYKKIKRKIKKKKHKRRKPAMFPIFEPPKFKQPKFDFGI